jgi:tryptophan synthase alpha chain
VREASLDIPVALMTYVNPVLRRGVEVFLDEARQARVSGMIVPDLPVDEAVAFDEACAERDLDAVLLAAPGATPARLAEIARRARGFVYCVATYGVTGARAELGTSAQQLVEALRPHTDLPLLVGVGIATPAHAQEASVFADGVIVGSALMSRMVDGDPQGMLDLVRGFRDALPRD